MFRSVCVGTCWTLNRYGRSPVNPLNAGLNPICHLPALLGAHPILHVSRIRVNLVLEELQTKHSSFFHVVNFRTVWLESLLRDCGATARCDVQCGGATCRKAECVSACGSSGYSGQLDTVEFYQKQPTHFSFRSYRTRRNSLRTSTYLRLCVQLERNSQNTNCNKQERERG